MPDTKKKIQALLVAAETVLAEGIARAARFEDANDFKQSLIHALDTHNEFNKAAKDLHTHATKPVPRSGRSEVARKVIKGGRVQAARHDSPRGRKNASKKRNTHA